MAVTTVANPLAGAAPSLADAAAERAAAASARRAPAASGGPLEPGNIDLHKRPVVKNADGSISTVRSMSFGEDGKEVLVPTVAANGSRILNDQEAIDQYHRTGQHLGKFATPEAATAYAQQLHQQQAREYLPPATNDSLGPAYQAHVQSRQVTSEADAERAAARASRAAAAAPGSATTNPTNATKPAEPPAPGTPEAAAATAAEEPGFLHRLGTNLAHPVAAMEASVPLGASALAEGGKDVLEGATVGAIPAVLGGARDATQHTLELIKSTGDWLDANVAHLPLPQSLQGAAEMPAQLPGSGTLTGTATEGVLRTGMDYLSGFALGGKVFDALKVGEIAGPAMMNVGKGVIADFVAMDPKGERLTNLWGKLGLPANVVTDWLAAKPGDSEIEGRFKNALEGAGLGALAGGIGQAADAWKAAREAAAAKPGAVVDAATAGAPKVSLEELKAKLGDPESQSFVRRNQPAAAPEAGADAKLAASAAATADVPLEAGAKGIAFAEHTPSFYVNWSKVDAPEDVQRAMSQMADAFTGDLEAARRGEVSFEQQKLGAQAENAWNVLVTRRQGQPLNAEQSLAARELWASSGAKLSELAQAAADSPSDANLFAFQKQLATHHMVQTQVVAARTETARALGSWRIPMGGDEERARQIDWLLANQGGQETTKELAKRMAILARGGNVAGLDMMAEKAASLTTMDAVRSVWVNAMLSSPATHLANVGDNLIMAAQQVWERYGAEKISAALGQQDGVAHGEALAQVYGMVSGWKDALRYAAKASVTGESGFGIGKIEEGRPFGIGQRATGLGGDYANNGGEFGRAVDYLGQMLRKPKVALGEVLNSPGTALVAEDEFFKTVGYRAEVHAQALRQATAEARAGLLDEHVTGAAVRIEGKVYTGANHGDALQAATDALGEEAVDRVVAPAMDKAWSNNGVFGFQTSKGRWISDRTAGPLASRMDQVNQFGGETVAEARARMATTADTTSEQIAMGRPGTDISMPELIGRRMAELVRDPPENIRMAAVDQALYQTLNNAPGELGKSILRLREALNVKGVPIGNVLMPFAKVPANSMSYLLARTPLATLMNTFSADIAAGGPRQSLALSRMAFGSLTMMATADLAMGGLITGSGPKDAVGRAALPRDWQPYSVKGVDGRYYSFNRLGAIGSQLGIAADLVDYFHNTDYTRRGGSDPVMPVWAAALLMTANNALSKSFVQGMAQVNDALADPQRYGPKFFEGLAGSVVPGIVATTAREMDPHAKDVRGMLDAIMARTPGLSDKIPNRLDLWGRPITYQSGLGGAYDMLSPVRATSGKTDEPIDKEIARQGIAPTLPQRVVSFAAGAPPTDLERFPGAYQRYQSLAGNEAKLPQWGGMGAKDYLNSVVSGRHPMSQVYRLGTDGPDGGKATFIKDVISKARAQALVMLRNERADVRVAVSRQMTTPRIQGVPAMPAVPMLNQ